MDIVRIDETNYNRFEGMLYWRMNGVERTENSDSIVFQDIINELNNANLYVYSAIIDCKMVGWISLIYLPKVGKYNGRGYVYVDELWVEPSYRGRGISKELMKKADTLVSELNASGIRLYVSTDNSVAKSCYESCGFAYSGETFFMEK